MFKAALRNRRKNDTAPAPELFFSRTSLRVQIRSSWFSWVWLLSFLFSWLQLRLLFVFTH